MRSRLLPIILLALAACAGAGPATAQTKPARDPAPLRTEPFPDVPKDHWAFDAVEQLRQRGILRGYPPEPKAAPRKPAPRKAASRKPRTA
jgi:hypothetical protein